MMIGTDGAMTVIAPSQRPMSTRRRITSPPMKPTTTVFMGRANSQATGSGPMFQIMVTAGFRVSRAVGRRIAPVVGCGFPEPVGPGFHLSLGDGHRIITGAGLM